MNTFKQCEDLFAKTRVPSAGKPLCNNTRLFKRADDIYVVRLHNTDVVTFFANGSVALNTGGWYTMTTKDRITAYAPVTIVSDRGVWYVEHRLARQRADAKARREFGLPGVNDMRYVSFADDTDYKQHRAFYKRVAELCRVPYFDGIMFGPGGRCLNGVSAAQWQKYLRDRDAMTKRVQAYCTKFNRALAKGIPMPGSGDCWFCSAIGIDNHSHLLHHMEEDYFVPSLAVNAIRAKGYSDAGVYIHLCMDPENDTMGGPRYRTSDGSMGGNTVRRALRDYLFDRLLPTPPSPHGEQRAPVREVKGVCNY